MRKHSLWIKPTAALLSGLLVAGLFPPFNMAGLAWVALMPLLAVLGSFTERRAGWKGFGLAWLAGSVSCGVQFRWLAEVSWLGALLLPLYLGLFWGLFGAYSATWGRAPAAATTRGVLRIAFCHGAVWAGLEWLRGWLFTGFGWNGLGVAFHDSPTVAQAADLLGVAGLSLVVVFCQVVLIHAGRWYFLTDRDARRHPGWSLAAAGTTVAMVLAYGTTRIRSEATRESVRAKALLVQLNIPQEATDMAWDDLTIHRAYEDDTLAALKAMADAAGPNAAHGPDWVIWPESALRGRILRHPAEPTQWATHQANKNTLAVIRTGGDFTLVFGAVELEAEPTDSGLLPKPDGRCFNTLSAISPDQQLQAYRKHHLVIFGETIPFIDSLPFLKKIYAQQAGAEYLGSFTSGDSYEPLQLHAGTTPIGVIPSVCFEDTVPRLPRHFARPSPQIILNVTNDGWFHESAAAAQHFANARFRCIELRRPMLRCANTGVTAAITTTGTTAHPDTGAPQILTDTKGSHFTRGTLLAEVAVPLVPASTLYLLIGDTGIISLAVVGLGMAWITRPKKLPHKDQAAVQ